MNRTVLLGGALAALALPAPPMPARARPPRTGRMPPRMQPRAAADQRRRATPSPPSTEVRQVRLDQGARRGAARRREPRPKSRSSQIAFAIPGGKAVSRVSGRLGYRHQRSCGWAPPATSRRSTRCPAGSLIVSVAALANVLGDEPLEGFQLLVELLGRNRMLGLTASKHPRCRLHGRTPGDFVRIGVGCSRVGFRRLGDSLEIYVVEPVAVLFAVPHARAAALEAASLLGDRGSEGGELAPVCVAEDVARLSAAGLNLVHGLDERLDLSGLGHHVGATQNLAGAGPRCRAAPRREAV